MQYLKAFSRIPLWLTLEVENAEKFSSISCLPFLPIKMQIEGNLDSKTFFTKILIEHISHIYFELVFSCAIALLETKKLLMLFNRIHRISDVWLEKGYNNRSISISFIVLCYFFLWIVNLFLFILDHLMELIFISSTTAGKQPKSNGHKLFSVFTRIDEALSLNEKHTYKHITHMCVCIRMNLRTCHKHPALFCIHSMLNNTGTFFQFIFVSTAFVM